MSLEIMVQHQDRVLTIYREAKNARIAFEQLSKDLPEISTMGFNTFRQYVCVMDKLAIATQSGDSDKQLAIANHELTELLVIANNQIQELAVANKNLTEQLAIANAELTEKLATVSHDNNLAIATKKLSAEGEGTEVSPKIDNQKIAGWNVTPFRGYYRAFRRINGKLHSLYLGKYLIDAETKIRAKEKQIAG